MSGFSAKWAARLELFRRLYAPPHWTPGMPVDAELRARYESCLPVCEFLADLGHLATKFPRPLCLAESANAHGHDRLGPAPFVSLPDLWNTLPEQLAGRVEFVDNEWLALFCALADPPRFGTDFGRYPEQLAKIRQLLGAPVPSPAFQQSATGPGPVPSFNILDLGCGTGQGTYELAAAVANAVSGAVAAVGVTREPLEVWMAENRRLPHDPARERVFEEKRPPALAQGRGGAQNDKTQAWRGATVHFLVGDALAVPCDGPFDLIVANGLVGGRFLRSPSALVKFLAEAERLLAAGGVLALANRFHAGELPALERFAESARRAGWTVEGELQNLFLRRGWQ